MVASQLMQAPFCSTCADVLIEIIGFEWKANIHSTKKILFLWVQPTFHFIMSPVMLLMNNLQQLPFERVLCMKYTAYISVIGEVMLELSTFNLPAMFRLLLPLILKQNEIIVFITSYSSSISFCP